MIYHALFTVGNITTVFHFQADCSDEIDERIIQMATLITNHGSVEVVKDRHNFFTAVDITEQEDILRWLKGRRSSRHRVSPIIPDYVLSTDM